MSHENKSVGRRSLPVVILIPLLTLTLGRVVWAQGIPEARLKAIYAMSPHQMAATGAWTRSAYTRLLGYIDRISDRATRELVQDMVLHPQSKVFKAMATQSFLASPASASKGHHYYPGGLAVHVVEWLDVAMAWADTYKKLHKVRNVDRDMVIAALILHDWGKVFYKWDPRSAKVVKPAWYPQAWGGEQGKAKWKWMGDHGAVVYAELYQRDVPEKLIVATAASHFDPHWDLDKQGEGLNPALAEAAKLAGKPPIVVKPQRQMFEWWFSAYTDGAWSYAQYRAGLTASDAIEAVAAELGLAPDSAEASKLSGFVLSRVSDYRLYEVYQTAGFNLEATKALVRSILKDSSDYEVAN